MPTPPNTRPMPAGLEALPELALNVRWTWSHATDQLWRELAPEIWAQTHNPWLILQLVPQSRLEQCARDAGFVAQVRHLKALRTEYLTQASWCSSCGVPRPPLVAYFCLEFGLAEALPLYAGGLGVLAGDHLKTASDLGVPMIGVGLLYSQGYFRQVLDADGSQRELLPPTAADSLPMRPALDGSGTPLCIALSLPGRSLLVRVWEVEVGRVSLLLLDCNDPRNGPADRGITATLYPAEPETRLLQQLVLGIGGWRALVALERIPEVCHLNEGPAALAALERARYEMQRCGLCFEEALWATRPGNVFTTHTPVAAAFDTFPAQWMLNHLGEDLAHSGIDEQEFLGLGRRNPSDLAEPFNPAYFGMRACGAVNAVSQAHQEVSRRLHLPLFPRRPAHEIPVGHVTNGVHVPSWDSAWADEVWTRAGGKRRWHGGLDDLASAVAALDDHTIWQLRNRERNDLIGFVRRQLVRQLHRRGQDGELVDSASHLLDPNALTLGFARRFAAYKRPTLLLRDAKRLARLLSSESRPVQLILAGKAHPRDEEGKAMIRQWTRFIHQNGMHARIVFLEDYDLDVAREMVQGVDLWINTPRRPWEACGTSGMKVLVNGGLNLSVRDGWWAEAYTPEVGWQIDGGNEDPDCADAADAEALYRTLEEQVVPLFYHRNADGLPQGWVTMVRASMSTLAPRFSSNRMLREYFTTLYCPGASAMASRMANGASLARDLRQWATTLRSSWHNIRIGDFTWHRDGARLRFDAQVYLGDITADSVAVELYADAPAGDTPVTMVMSRGGAIDGAANAYLYRAEVNTARNAGDFTPRVVPFHANALIPLESQLIRWGSPALGLIHA